MKREPVKGKDFAGNEVSLYVTAPGHKDHQLAQLQYNMKVAELIRDGAGKSDRLLMRSEIEGYLTKMGIWTKEDQIAYNRIQSDIRSNEIALRSGGMKLSEARLMALNMSDLRGKLLGLYAKRSQLDGTTVEATAENHKFNFLVTRCVVKENGHPYFADVDEYMARSSEEITVLAATALARIVYGYNENFSDSLFESQWLRKYHFMDDQGRLTDREGHLVDRTGMRINEQGRYINEAGELIDREGNRLDEEGNLLIDTKPFIDDATGEALAEEKAPESSAKKTKGKRTRTKAG